MKIAAALVLIVLAFPVVAQDDLCGGAALTAMENAPAEKDPEMQAKLGRLHASLRKSHEQCKMTLKRAQERDERMGIASLPRPAPATPVIAPLVVNGNSATPAASCSVVSASGKPCVRKTSEIMGKAGNPDQVVFENSCQNAIEVSVLYKDASRGLSTVKANATATLLCDNCGGVKSTEAVCK